MAIECRETHAELRRAIEDVLSDTARSGSTGTFTAEQVTQILAVACERPDNRGGRSIAGLIANWLTKSSAAGL